MEPTSGERHGGEGRTAERAGASESNALQNPDQVVGRLCQTPSGILDPGKQRVRFADYMSIRQSPPLRIRE